MKKMIVLPLLALLLSCQKKEEAAKPAEGEAKKEECAKPAASGEKEFEMYQMSEMAALMEDMYQKNLALKSKIEKGEKVGKFDSNFLKIHQAVMTDPSENDAFFKAQAAAFLQSQQRIFEDPKNAKEHFNNSVNTCISCHQVKCTGPIARIKKLYID